MGTTKILVKLKSVRILFVTSYLEPEKGGVADYTRLLACECVRRGHDVFLLALNDKYTSSIKEDRLKVLSRIVRILRVPSSSSWKEKVFYAKRVVNSFDPDWISLQFVCYGFNPKGIVWDISRPLKRIFSGRNVQMMLHELWIGENEGASLKDRVYRVLQKHFILKLICKLAPQVIHTQTRSYLAILEKYGVHARYLPLFGNLPFVEEDEQDGLEEILRKEGLSMTDNDRKDHWFFGMFGSIHPAWAPEPLLSLIKIAQEACGKKTLIISVGNTGAGKKIWNDMANKYRDVFSFVDLGVRPGEIVSSVLAGLDFGIVTTPYQLIGKSGSATAMLERGLPVIVTRDIRFNGLRTVDSEHDPLIIRLDEHLPEKLKEIRQGVVRSRLPEVTRCFLKDLAKYENINSVV